MLMHSRGQAHKALHHALQHRPVEVVTARREEGDAA
jgi:hypothetical protein